MQLPKISALIVSIVIIASAWLFYFVRENHKITTQNANQVSESRGILKDVDATFYKMSALELNTQKYIITGDKSFQSAAQQQISELHNIIESLDSIAKLKPHEYSFMPLLVKKLDIHETLIRNSSSPSQAAAIIEKTENKNLTTSFYQSLIASKENYVAKINSLLAKSESIDLRNFQSSLIICLSSFSLIIIILLQVFRNLQLRKVAENDNKILESKYEELVQSSGVGLMTTDLNGKITFINKRISSFTGYEPEEIVGKHFSSIVEDGSVQSITKKLQKQLHLRQYESTMAFPLKAKNGNTIWVEQSSVILMQGQQPKGFQCIVKDITEKRRIQTEIKKLNLAREENEFRLQSILDNTPLIIFIKDLEGRYLLVNKSYRDAFNFSKGQVIGKTDFELVDQSDAQRYREIDEYVIKEKRNVEVEETIAIDGADKNLLIVKFPLFDKNNNIYGIGGIASDITERYLYGLHLIESRKKAEVAEHLQEQFLANMSHDIRTPMNGIIGMTNILLNTQMTEEQRDFLEVIKKSSDNLLVLINDILDLSKIKAGKLRIEKIDFRLRETIEHAIGTFRVLINDKGLKLRVSVELGIPDSLTGDPHRLNQILNNLISNAIKFTSEGEIVIEVKSINQKENELELSFSVSDSGIGISEEQQQLIFESFSQAETGTARKFGGSGLGLSITKKLIELQNGSIAVNSKPGEGSTFVFSIKYTIASHVVPKLYNSTKQQNLNQEGLAGKRILVAEDNEANQKVIFHILQKAGIQTDLADNGKEAIKFLEEGFEYDLIIMDLQMPEMDGFETTVYIRQKLNLSIPIIAMTASALRNEKIKCMELGMNEYLNKPFVPADLFRELRKFLLKENEEIETAKTDFMSGDSTKLYNLNHLIELDDIDCLCEVLQIFMESTPVLMREIKNAINEKNWDEVYKKSHKIKSSIGMLQMGKLMSLISKVESGAKERKNPGYIESNFEKAETLFAQITPLIQRELENAALLVKN